VNSEPAATERLQPTDPTGPQWVETFVLLYQSGPDARSRIPQHFPAHHDYSEAFRARRPGVLLMIGPFAESLDGQPGAMSIFTSREAAEDFAAGDPFVLNGVVDTWYIRPWLTSP